MKLHILCGILLATLAMSIEDKASYIVMFDDKADEIHVEKIIQQIEELTSSSRNEMEIESDMEILPMLIAKFDEKTAEMVSKLELVDIVEKDQIKYKAHPFDVSEQSYNIESSFPVPDRYNLDIIDNVNCTDGTFTPFNDGTGVDIYILDTGINYDHIDFGWMDGNSGSRAQYGGYDAIDVNRGETQNGRDCDGHGTHCAAIAAGLNSGVAKNANLYSIRVLGCDGFGSDTELIRGMWAVYRRHKAHKNEPNFKGSIISMSIGGAKSSSVDNVVNKLVGKKSIVVVTASGNEFDWACYSSPGGADKTINVGAHGYSSESCVKPMAWYSNYGSCVDILAPGVEILSANYTDVNGFTPFSGTSMACPHVAGVAALMKAGNKDLTPDQIKDNLKTYSIKDIDMSDRPNYVRSSSTSDRLYVTPNLLIT